MAGWLGGPVEAVSSHGYREVPAPYRRGAWEGFSGPSGAPRGAVKTTSSCCRLVRSSIFEAASGHRGMQPDVHLRRVCLRTFEVDVFVEVQLPQRVGEHELARRSTDLRLSEEKKSLSRRGRHLLRHDARPGARPDGAVRLPSDRLFLRASLRLDVFSLRLEARSGEALGF